MVPDHLHTVWVALEFKSHHRDAIFLSAIHGCNYGVGLSMCEGGRMSFAQRGLYFLDIQYSMIMFQYYKEISNSATSIMVNPALHNYN